MDNLEEHYNFLNTIIKGGEGGNNKCDKEECCKLKENYQNDNGTITCKECSNIITNICNNPEWRYYGSKDNKNNDPTRCGMPINSILPESSVGSSVSYSSNSPSMVQIRKYQQWSGMPYKERSLYKVFLTIQNTCLVNNIPSIIIEEAKSIYSIISKTKISRGSNRQGIIAACVYFACKECRVPRSSQEIADIFDLNKNTMTKGIKKCQEIIYMNKQNKHRLSKSEPTRPCDFIHRFCNRLKISEEDTQLIVKICELAISKNIISENTPPSVASGCIYYFIKKKKLIEEERMNQSGIKSYNYGKNELGISKKLISDICKISEVTINKCCRLIEQNDEVNTKEDGDNKSFYKILNNSIKKS